MADFNNFFKCSGYGLTETSPATHFSRPRNSKIGSVGPPLSRTQSKVVDIDTGEALGPHQRGELCIKGPQVMKRYLNDPEATKQAIDSPGWLRTGDIAYYDEEGDFFVIKVKGYLVSPTELEDLIMSHPAVADAAIIGVPDDYAGELPRAYVVKKPGTLVNEDDIKKFLHPKIAPYKHLNGGVYFVESIPKSNTGKTLKKEMKKFLN